MQPGWRKTSREGSSPLITSSESREGGLREAGARVTWTDTSFNLIHWSMQQRGVEAREGDNQEAGPLKMCSEMTWKRLDLETKSKEEQSQAEHN